MSVQKMKRVFHSCGVDLSVRVIREQDFYSSDTYTMEFNIKLDGRPLVSTVDKAVSLQTTEKVHQFIGKVNTLIIILERFFNSQ